jgi:hypothetical protein
MNKEDERGRNQLHSRSNRCWHASCAFRSHLSWCSCIVIALGSVIFSAVCWAAALGVWGLEKRYETEIACR